MKTRLLFLLIFSSCFLSGCVSQNVRPVNLSDASQKNVQLGLSYLSKGDHVRARQKLLLAIQESPKSASAQEAFGYLLFKEGEVDQAKDYYKRAEKYDAYNGEIQNNYGIFLCDTGHYTDGIRHFLKAVEDVHYLYPDHAYHNAALCAQKIPDPKLVRKYFAKEEQYKGK